MRNGRHPFVLVLAVMALLAVSSFGATFTPAVNTIYSFSNSWSVTEPLLRFNSGLLYGVTTTGGTSNYGGVFEVSSNGDLVRMLWFDGANGATPRGPLTTDAAGNIYGTASLGGISNNGTIFTVSKNGLEVVAKFNGTNGSNPEGPLILGTNGWLYGTTYKGATNRDGGIFRVNGSGVLSNVFSFNGTDGANPAFGLIKGTNNNFYGTTQNGGTSGLGTIFKFTYSNTLTTIASLNSQTGAFPGRLVQDTSSNFYGTAVNGGSNFAGTIFRATTNSVQPIFDFALTNGSIPNPELVSAGANSWYGTTEQGGRFGQGTVFLFNSRGLFADVLSFDGTNGANPQAGLILGGDGNYYGTTTAGGSNGAGGIYELTGFAPYVITPPASVAYASNHNATFSVVAGGTAPLSYQWQFDGTNAGNDIPGATNSSLLLTHEQLTNSGTYTVVISNAYGILTTSAVLRVAAPTVAVAAVPATVTSDTLTISGTAADRNGIAAVQYQLNSNGWNAASGTTRWTTTVTLVPGTNIFQVESVDPLGNLSAIKTVKIFYEVLSPITIDTSGLGSVVTSFKGTDLILGRNYTVRAVPSAKWLFENWSGSISSTNNPLAFTMQSDFTLTANFVTNPFIATAGSYAGLFYTDGEVGLQSAGLVSSLVLNTAGGLSGQMFIKGTRYGFTGHLDATGSGGATVARPAAQGGAITLQLSLGSNEITGTVSGTDEGGWSSPLLAEAVTKPSGSGQYTILIPSGTAAAQGDGYLLVTNHNGTVSLTGAMADGAAMTQSTPIVGGGDVPFYASLYGKTGLALGWFNINDALSAPGLWWIKTGTDGFTNDVTDLQTSPWTIAPTDYFNGGTLGLSDTNIDLDFTVSIVKSALVKDAGSLTNSLSGTFNAKTGLLKIVFGDGIGKQTLTGAAAFLGNSGNGGGYFLTKTNAGAVALTPATETP